MASPLIEREALPAKRPPNRSIPVGQIQPTKGAQLACSGPSQCQSAVFPLAIDGLTVPGYAALYALAINFAVSAVLSLLLNPIGATRGADQTTVTDYHL